LISSKLLEKVISDALYAQGASLKTRYYFSTGKSFNERLLLAAGYHSLQKYKYLRK